MVDVANSSQCGTNRRAKKILDLTSIINDMQGHTEALHKKLKVMESQQVKETKRLVHTAGLFLIHNIIIIMPVIQSLINKRWNLTSLT